MKKREETISGILTDWLRASFVAEFGDDLDLSGITAVETANAQFGDYQCNAAMSLAKVLKSAPRAIAERLVAGAPEHAAVHRLGNIRT